MGACFSKKNRTSFQVSELQPIPNKTNWAFQAYSGSETTIDGLYFSTYDCRNGTFVSMLHHQTHSEDTQKCVYSKRKCVYAKNIGFCPDGIEITIDEGCLCVHFMCENRREDKVVWNAGEYYLNKDLSIKEIKSKKQISTNAESVDMTTALSLGQVRSCRNQNVGGSASSGLEVHQMRSSSSTTFILFQNGTLILEVLIGLFQMKGDETFDRNVKLISIQLGEFPLVMDLIGRMLTHVSQVHRLAFWFFYQKEVLYIDADLHEAVIKKTSCMVKLSQTFLNYISSADFLVELLFQMFDQILLKLSEFQKITSDMMTDESLSVMEQLRSSFSGLSTTKRCEFGIKYSKFTSMIMDFRNVFEDSIESDTMTALCVPSCDTLSESHDFSLIIKGGVVFSQMADIHGDRSITTRLFTIPNLIVKQINDFVNRGVEMKQILDLLFIQQSNVSSTSLMLNYGVAQEIVECDDIKQGEPFRARSLNIELRQTMMDQLRNDMKSLKTKMDKEKIEEVKASIKHEFEKLFQNWKQLKNSKH